ncbi:ankyrin repeat and SOCS box protein 11-like isoform X2 [Petromyzon marinus]|uniref:Serine/threonine-protein phosphatase 6 regulatory ankyrin repeat subunit C-like isoform X2 n=1 Tax=Petromyzon marinus TaxID=7757 RepID=A0AAJ7XBJ8_PETMA|nr:serine/threonine-protein phosphatase 6 regulatory ankyrin repeat subunit C-like isoform X2 [Petromyzon marinus]
MGLHGSSLRWFGTKRSEGDPDGKVSGWCKRCPSYDHNWTDLHYAASRGDLHKLNILLHATGSSCAACCVVCCAPCAWCAGLKVWPWKRRAPGWFRDTDSCDSKDFYGKTPLYWAAYKGHRACMEQLIGHGADVNSQCKHGSTPLHTVIGLYPDCAILLIQHGADVNQSDKWGVTPMYLAACNGHLDGLRLLVHAGAVMTYRNKKTGEVPKQLATRASVVSWLEGCAGTPRSLKHLARVRIARQLARPRREAVRRLCLPAVLESYLMFDDLAQCLADEGLLLLLLPVHDSRADQLGAAAAART